MKQSRQPAPPLLNGYSLEPDTYDEMWLGDGQAQPHWQPFMQALEEAGPEELDRWQQEVRRQLRENGVTYNVHGALESHQRLWALDLVPLIINQSEWQVIESGMRQRAELLDLVLADIYGEQRLIKVGLLPMELVYGHAGFLRQCHGLQLSGKRQLIIYAADLARGPDRRMWVLSDRTQAPSGAGYALENRTIMARVLSGIFREYKIYRLSNFFREFQNTLARLAGPRSGSPRVVVLTPGPLNETYFEHAFLASYLSYSLVQGDDLTTRDGKVWLKALAGLQPVDVILRRVDDIYCDPLELREDSRLGVAGLLETARRQNIAIANPLGSSVLENPGLTPFLPGLARHLLGQDLILPSTATWWCGQPKELAYVLANLDRLVIKQLSRQPHSRTLFGNRLSRGELDGLRAQIKAQPQLYVGQEQVSFSTLPSLVGRQLEARHMVLRSFVVARDDDYLVMPGGLTRIAPQRGDLLVSNRAGGISKDTWVLTSEPQKHISLWLQPDQIEQAFKSSYHLPSRAAENLFWVGRYAERVEATARLLRMIFRYFSEEGLSGDEIETETLPYLLQGLTQVTMTYPGFVGEGSQQRLARPMKELVSVTLDQGRPGSLLFNLKAMLSAAYAVRDLWSTDTWRVINELDLPWERKQSSYTMLAYLQPNLDQLVTILMAFAGLNTESMTHEAGWLLLDIGRRLERALLSIAFIRSTLAFQCSQPVEALLLDNILRVTENIITYRRRYRSYLQPQTVLDLLLLDPTNPRSLIYQLDRLREHIAQLPRETTAYHLSLEERLILEASTRLRLVDTGQLAQTVPESGLRQNLDDFMAYLTTLLSQLSEVVTQAYFTHTQSPRQLVASSLSLLPSESGADLKHVA
jgi:uncharacterized circularly permuted ATP-grasp superfamily protein/uncharacterized alpha-E superfamily protein